MGAFVMPRWGWYAIAAVVALGLFYGALHSYGKSRYNAGKADEKAAWKAAETEMLQKAANAGSAADKNAALRSADFMAKVTDEREKINAANAEGASPFDVLFNTDGG